MKYLSPKNRLKLSVAFILMSNFIYPQWNVQYSQNYDILECIHFVDYNNGWAVGYNGSILKLNDEGET